ncbi:hypothetical protein [Chitinimonas sp.]|uniref:hypothetical protein n=1 Tax=Chitinimonas sp. TaxID=1934313 RepID=UPI002F927881
MNTLLKPLGLALLLGLPATALAEDVPLLLAAETATAPKAAPVERTRNVVEKRIVITRVGEDGQVAPMAPIPPIPPIPPLPEVINLQLPDISGMVEGAMAFTGQEFAAGGATVAGAPYSAEAQTERVQTLLDGNRLIKRSTTRLYRDEQGRTRQEILADDGSVRQVFIFDPVAGAHYLLSPASKKATKLPWGKGGGERVVVNRTVGTDKEGKVLTQERIVKLGDLKGASATRIVVMGGEGEGAPSTRSLGNKDMDGVKAEGSEYTRVIPAGRVGNEKPIQIVTERWYAPELKLVLATTTRDPRTGESSYRLAKLKRSEPDSALFKVPADYQLRDVLADLPKPPMPPKAPPAPPAPPAVPKG